MGRGSQETLREITEQERQTLETVVRAGSERVDRVRRAQVLLVVAKTGSFVVAAQRAGWGSVTSVTHLVQRFTRCLTEESHSRGRIAS